MIIPKGRLCLANIGESCSVRGINSQVSSHFSCHYDKIFMKTWGNLSPAIRKKVKFFKIPFNRQKSSFEDKVFYLVRYNVIETGGMHNRVVSPIYGGVNGVSSDSGSSGGR